MDKLKEIEIIKAALYTDILKQKEWIETLRKQQVRKPEFEERLKETEDLYDRVCKKYFKLKVESESVKIQEVSPAIKAEPYEVFELETSKEDYEETIWELKETVKRYEEALLGILSVDVMFLSMSGEEDLPYDVEAAHDAMLDTAAKALQPYFEKKRKEWMDGWKDSPFTE